VITGGPGTGKSTLVHSFEARGYYCMHEISREVILQAQEEGIAQLFLENPLLFSQKLMEGRHLQYEQAENLSEEILFYDRGMPDVTAYMNYLGIHYPKQFSEMCLSQPYDMVFLLPPWEAIYEPDNERYESFEEATRIYGHLREEYAHYGYTMHEIPKSTIEDRCDFILGKISKLL
jgi:predicted ATPase